MGLRTICHDRWSIKTSSAGSFWFWQLQLLLLITVIVIVVKSLSRVQFFMTPWTAARQASLSITNSWSLLKLMSIKSVMPSNHLLFCRPRLLLLSIFPGVRVLMVMAFIYWALPLCQGWTWLLSYLLLESVETPDSEPWFKSQLHQFSSCVTFGKSINLSVPQILHMGNRLSWVLKQLIAIKCLEQCQVHSKQPMLAAFLTTK